jgi:hypothetical protein
MAEPDLPELVPGPQPGFLAWLNDLRRLVLSTRIVTDAGSGLTQAPHPDGTAVRLNALRPFYITLTGGGAGGKYAWTEAIPIDPAADSWRAGHASGTTATDPAIEANLNAGITGLPRRVIARRDAASNELIFWTSNC